MKNKYTAVSLFSASGIGDIGLKTSGYDFLLMCEIEHDRSQLLKLNYPKAKIVTDDIRDSVEKIVCNVRHELQGEELFLITCTAPCQGMSKSGQGKLLQGIREGKRPKLDSRNRLILPAMDIIKELKPKFVIFENVCEMRNTLIEDNEGNIRPILDIINTVLREEYWGEAYDVEFANYGIAQRRKRLIIVYTKGKNASSYFKKGISLIPKKTHSKVPGGGKKPWVSVEEIIKGLPPLDAKSKETAKDLKHSFHRVPVLDSKKYEWIKHTPVNCSAFDNQCINPKCRYKMNRSHGTSKNHLGINQAHKDTPLFCEKCGDLLPRPYTKKKDGTMRIMFGYTSAYKRMDPKLPAPTLTRNMSFPCSDHKIHPYENRVLSFGEAFRIHSLNLYNYKWGPIRNKKGKILDHANDTLIRESIGESIPPKFLELLGERLIKLTKKNERFEEEDLQFTFFNNDTPKAKVECQISCK